MAVFATIGLGLAAAGFGVWMEVTVRRASRAWWLARRAGERSHGLEVDIPGRRDRRWTVEIYGLCYAVVGFLVVFAALGLVGELGAVRGGDRPLGPAGFDASERALVLSVVVAGSTVAARMWWAFYRRPSTITDRPSHLERLLAHRVSTVLAAFVSFVPPGWFAWIGLAVITPLDPPPAVTVARAAIVVLVGLAGLWRAVRVLRESRDGHSGGQPTGTAMR